ncbi:MAG: sel1 repeat family protein [Thermoguttaceae bacterium]|nr:sel1 repeat family protein [Thermoguttaceae bacterium]
MRGTGCEKDPVKAVHWLRLAAGQGNDSAQYELGKCLVRGVGCVQDIEEGKSWLNEANQRGNQMARDRLFELMATGSIGEDDPDLDW